MFSLTTRNEIDEKGKDDGVLLKATLWRRNPDEVALGKQLLISEIRRHKKSMIFHDDE